MKSKNITIQDICAYNKIVIVGNAGSGKSWLSKRIGEISGNPLYHLDNEFWQPEWQQTPKEEFITCQQNIIATDKWIIDGNYGSTLELRLAACDLIIFLDINRLVCILSAAKRAGKKRSDLPNYLTEQNCFSKEFKEFKKMIWNFNKTKRPSILSKINNHPTKQFLHIKTRRQTKKLIKLWTKTKTNKGTQNT